jgi:hypothetical protein
MNEFTYQPMDTAPKDREISVNTEDFGEIRAKWDEAEIDFAKSQPDWASYDPDNMQGTWVFVNLPQGEKDKRLYCGYSPNGWRPEPSLK